MMVKFICKSKEETQELGKLLAKESFVREVITLKGQLGAGKTTFSQGFANGLGIKGIINSPTFNIVKCYFDSIIPLYHIDAYRLEDGTNKDIGLEEFIDGDGLCVIEWPNFIDYLIPNLYLSINIEHVDGDIRKFKISSKDERWNSLIDSLKEEFLCTESF